MMIWGIGVTNIAGLDSFSCAPAYQLVRGRDKEAEWTETATASSRNSVVSA